MERVIFLRRLIFILVMIVTVFLVYENVNASSVIIPDSAIRLRVIPNSNVYEDILMKQKVKNYLENNLFSLFEEVNDVDTARSIISSNLDNINENINNIFAENNYDMNYDVNFGYNYFPEKEFDGVKYKAGEYESLVVSIGEAKGDNFWCVLFPSFCMLEVNDNKKNDYKFFLKDVIDKYF